MATLTEKRLTLAPWVEKLHDFRFTLTPRLLNYSRNIFVLATGTEKADVVNRALSARAEDLRYPIQMIQPTAERFIWLLDHAASGSAN